MNTSWQLLQGVGEREKVMRRILERGFEHREQGEVEEAKACELSRETYASMYGPTTGDLVRLGDTDLWVEVERDLTSYGDELKFGGGEWRLLACSRLVIEDTTLYFSAGKVIREGMGSATGRPDAMTLDLVITNALIIDWSGIYKVDISSASENKCTDHHDTPGRHWRQEQFHCRHRQGWEPGHHGRRLRKHDRWRQYGGHCCREDDCHGRSDRFPLCVAPAVQAAREPDVPCTSQFTTFARSCAQRPSRV